MKFHPENVERFKSIYAENWRYIQGFDGCSHVELLQDKTDESVFFTYSHWVNEQALEKYRHSELFKKVWSSTKVLFSDKPQAWTLEALTFDQ